MSLAITAAWALLKRLPWKQIGLALAALGLVLLLWRAPWADARGRAAEAAKLEPQLNRALDRIRAAQASFVNIRAAMAKAHDLNLAHVAAVEASDSQIRKEQTDALSRQRDDALARADRYILQHAAANPGHAGEGGISAVAHPAGASDSPAQGAVVVGADDIRACTEAYVTASGWQAWWAAEVAKPR